MKRFRTSFLISCAALAAPAVCSAQSLARALAESPGYAVVYTYTVLANGLRVLVVEQREAPVVAAELMVRAGSRDEPENRRDLAHLLEHSTAGGIPDDLWRGVVFNASTGGVWTDYFFTAHPAYLDQGLYALAANLRTDLIDVAGLEAEREVVVAESRQSANAAYSRARFCLRDLLHGAPTCHALDATEAGQRAITAEDLTAFHRLHYRPDNAVLVVVGDVSARDAVARAERWFGELSPTGAPRSSRPARTVTPRRVRIEDPFAPRTRIDLAYAPAGASLQRTAILNVLMAVLGGGSAPLLARNPGLGGLIEEVEVHGFDFRRDSDAPLVVTAYLTPQASVDEAIASLERELRRFTANPLQQAELVRAKGVLAREFAEDTRNDGARGLAFNLVYFTAVHDEPERINAWLPAVERVTAEEVAQAAREIFADGPVAVVVTVPAGGSAHQ